MLRPNLAQDAPPTSLLIGGAEYEINVDYRAWIGVMHDLRELDHAPGTPEAAMQNAETLARIEKTVFGRIIPAGMPEMLGAITEFLQGYPEAPVIKGNRKDVQTYSLEWDLNHIILAIRSQYGIDLSWRRKEAFHFWEFLAYFRALCGDHYILRLIEIRGYDGKDPELKRQAQRYALPRETTTEDRAILDEFDKLFYNA